MSSLGLLLLPGGLLVHLFIVLALGAITARRLRVGDAGADFAMARLIARSQFSVAPLVLTLFVFLFVSHVKTGMNMYTAVTR